MLELQTPRLLIRPLEPAALREYASERGPRLDAGFAQVLTAQILPQTEASGPDWLFFTLWLMLEKADGAEAGSLCFKGPPAYGMVEIGYGTEPAFRNKGYCAEALAAVARWCALRQDILRLTAQSRADNAPSRRVLEKCGFKPTDRVLSEDGFPLTEFELLFPR